MYLIFVLVTASHRVGYGFIWVSLLCKGYDFSYTNRVTAIGLCSAINNQNHVTVIFEVI